MTMDGLSVVDMTTADQAIVADGIADIVDIIEDQVPQADAEELAETAEELMEMVFEHADRFLRADGTPHLTRIFHWLANTANQNEGVVDHDTIGSPGTAWLLAQALGETLQDTVQAVQTGAAAEQALEMARIQFELANMMFVWRMNDQAHYDRIFEELLKTEDGAALA